MSQDAPFADSEAVSRRIAELERKVAVLTSLAEISNVLNSTIRLKPLLNALMEAAASFVDAEAASVLLWDADTNELRFAAATNDDTTSLLGKPVPLEGSIAGQIWRENRIVVVNNVERSPNFYSRIDKDTALTTRSVIGVPMRSKNRVIGVLEAVNKRTPPWTEDDGRILTILASQAAVAIEGARLVMALQTANEELSKLDKMKNDFIAIASHELRTPLSIILGYASFLQETNDPEVRELADRVVKSAMALRSLIEDMTNLRYLEGQAAMLNRERISLDDFLRDCLNEIRPLAKARGHDLRFIPSPQPFTLEIDPIRMAMAVTNLLNNAVRFTPNGGTITLSAAPHGNEIWITVRDTGIGIALTDMERIFEKFVQVEDHMTREHGGMGIGLSISRGIVEAHGGRVWAHSAGLNQGSTFTIALPMR
jgi:signal transduction histidine kinase